MRVCLLATALAGLSLVSAGTIHHEYEHSKQATASQQVNETSTTTIYGQHNAHTAMKAGEGAKKACEALATTFKSSLNINNTFAIYYPEGSNPSLERLTAQYPAGTIPPEFGNAYDILEDVGPDVDLTKEFGYGQCRGRFAKNGPLGGLPAFCRFGAYIPTSPLTNVLAEVWLPLSSDPEIPLAKVDTADYPTNSTPIELSPNGDFIKKPTWIDEALKAAAAAKAEEAAEPKTPKDGAAATTPADTPSTSPSSVDTKAPDASSASADTKDAKAPVTAETMKAGASDAKAPAAAGANKAGASGAENAATTTDAAASSDASSNSGADTASPAAAAVKPTKRAPRDQAVITGEELFGSSEGWNGRLALLANGGQRGFVPLTDMKQFLCRYGYTVAGSNAGHFSTTGGVTWVNGTHREETLKDFGSRANHVTKILSDEVIDAFYGADSGVRVKKPDGKSKVRSYMTGCSVGGGRALSSAQVYADDFDGLMAGAASIGFNRMNQAQMKVQKLFRRADAGPGRVNLTTLAGPVHNVILSQCDKLDGINDGVLTLPRLCKPRFAPDLLCGSPTAKYGGSNDTCLTERQIANLEQLYTPTIIEGKNIYPAYLPGIEQRVNGFTGVANKAIGWTLLAFGRYQSLPPASEFDGFNNITLEMIELGERTDPGGVNGQNPDISAFLNRGGKLIMYHGLADSVISPLASSQYYDDVVKTVTPKLKGKKVSDGFRHFEIPGMSHCRDGPGPWCFGSSTQNDAGNRPLKYDTKHDMVLALVAWAERDLAPEAQVGASYGARSVVLPRRLGEGNATEASRIPITFRSFEYGVLNTRILCPYPASATYLQGPTTGEEAYRSFECRVKEGTY